ncbi:hypothetical protein PhCBS80983_g04798 [Powellomyces hirtus]|uniref:Uncharacterized protein n=1 Tax=Powellomyces hirtus TaxID=109895 RepID=A0A507DXJ8_9FUNG|nr:hypothetical protein PhCBS80983_g04798 [Powellomyces hirtus]
MYNSNTPTPSWSPPPIQAPVPQHPQRPGPMSFGSASGSFPNSPQPMPRGPPPHQQQHPSRQQSGYSNPSTAASSSSASFPQPQQGFGIAAGYAPQPYHRPTPHQTSSFQQQQDFGQAGYAAPQGTMGQHQQIAGGGGAGGFGGGGGFGQPGHVGGQMGGPQHQQQWGTNLINEFQTSAAGQLGMQLGNKAFEQAQENLNKNMHRWINIPHLKYYFNVSNSYVLNKIRLLLFPFRHQSWTRLVRRSEQSGQMEGYKPPREDLNAPDLYIPVMTFVTYILLVGIRLGLDDAANAAAAGGKFDPTQIEKKMSKSFSPDILGMTGTTAFFIVFFEVLCFKLGFYLLNVTTDVPFLDLVSYSGYKFLGVITALVAKIIFPATWVVYGVLAYAMLCLGFFTVRCTHSPPPQNHITLFPH